MTIMLLIGVLGGFISGLIGIGGNYYLPSYSYIATINRYTCV